MNDVKKDKSSSNEGGDYEINPRKDKVSKTMNRDSSQE